MKVHSIIISGTLAGILLIFSCISLNTSRFYNELEVTTPSIHLVSKPTFVLRDRQ